MLLISSLEELLITCGIALLIITGLFKLAYVKRVFLTLFKIRKEFHAYTREGRPIKRWVVWLWLFGLFVVALVPFVLLWGTFVRSSTSKQDDALVRSAVVTIHEQEQVRAVERRIPSLLVYQTANNVMLPDSLKAGKDKLETVFDHPLASQFRNQPALFDSFTTHFFQTSPSLDVASLSHGMYTIQRPFKEDSTKQLTLYFKKVLTTTPGSANADRNATQIQVEGWRMTSYRVE